MRKLALVLLAGLVVPAGAQEFLGKSAANWADEAGDRSKPANQRRSAAFALGKIGSADRTAVGTLVLALGDDDARVCDAAAFALGEIAGRAGNEQKVWAAAGAELRRCLTHRDGRVRRSAAYALGHCGAYAEASLPQLTGALADAEPRVRQSAAYALGKVGKNAGTADAVAALTDRLKRNGEDALVLRDVATALTEIGRPSAEPAVKPLAELINGSADPVVRKTVLNAVVNLVGPGLAKDVPGTHAQLVRALQDGLRDGDPAFRGLAAGALANLGEHAAPALRDLAGLVSDTKLDEKARRNAVLALAKMPKTIRELPGDEAREVVRKLALALDAAQPTEVRRYTAEALARIGFPLIDAALAPLLTAIEKDPDVSVRHRSVWSFLNADDLEKKDGAVPTLVRALRDENRAVRYDAARSLARGMGPRADPAAIDTLEEMLNDASVKVYNQTNADVKGGRESTGGTSDVKADLGGDGRFMAAQALGMIGPKAKRPSIVKVLREMTTSKDERIREHAEAALRSIGG